MKPSRILVWPEAGTTLFGLYPPPGAQSAPAEAPRVVEILLADAQLAASI